MRNLQAESQILKYLHQQQILTGIFMSFWVDIPRTAKRAKQKAHLAIYRCPNTGLTGVFIPITYFPQPGSSPPRKADIILPHATFVFVRKKLARYGIENITGAVSEREIDCGRVLLH
ncbi:MAG: hypothetical protein ACI9H6_000717 [Patiriisocius sp.]|jgi:hypothetical protein